MDILRDGCKETTTNGCSNCHISYWNRHVQIFCCLCKSISPFTMGIYDSPYDYVIHIATPWASLIVSFQPPLGTLCWCIPHFLFDALYCGPKEMPLVMRNIFRYHYERVHDCNHCTNFMYSKGMMSSMQQSSRQRLIECAAECIIALSKQNIVHIGV